MKAGLLRLVGELRQAGKTVAAYGAAAKGNTLLNYCGIDRREIAFVADRSTHKQGRYLPGSRIRVEPAEALSVRRPDYVLLLAWNFAPEIVRQQAAYLASGGRFLVPVPVPRVVTAAEAQAWASAP